MKKRQCEQCSATEFEDVGYHTLRCSYCGTEYDVNDLVLSAITVITQAVGNASASVTGNGNTVITGAYAGVIGNGPKITGGIHFG